MNNHWLRAWRSATAGGLTAAAMAVVAIAVCAPFAWKFVNALLIQNPKATAPGDDVKERVQQYAAAFDPYVKQLDGRSLFYEPSAPGTEGEVIPEEPADDTNPDAPAPTRYDGPAISAVVLDTVWFADGARVKVGEGRVGDMEVLSTNTPWDVRVNWRGTEFTVPFFDRDKVIFKDRPAAPSPPPTNESEPTDASPVGTATPQESAAPAVPPATDPTPSTEPATPAATQQPAPAPETPR
ncbi:MAG TPA: hypothetical protein VHN77_15225 [Phycisphaerales bacterium]|nr:hypothetical protein [Phycisphaerales bacterium]